MRRAALVPALLLAASLAPGMSTPVSRAAASSDERQVLDLINDERERHDLDPVTWNEQLARLDVRAPLAGVVLDMAVHALKSVVRPAEPILYIVPSDSELVVDAQVDPIHIDTVRRGQEAVLRFSAFNARTTPELFGTVSNVSPDAFVEEQSGRSFYKAEVMLKDGEMAKLEGQELVAGMPVETYITTGDRSPFSYFTKPMADYFNKAFREE